ncbi:uncharacterized protein LOC127127552 [Lathyrus oleraceus]|uniref:uncharacterized protein LOC127127552 n=1 Tax=Pisum sativum TaxID=3888 RepID=UPI0021D03413|nr:uncharacterized protein LOC127127552 [Pisum sativum]
MMETKKTRGAHPWGKAEEVLRCPDTSGGFVERWHKETPTFHLSLSDMTITLDDVSSLIHLLFQAWRCVALTVLYSALGEAIVLETRQIFGYMSLFQCWIYKHFLSIYDRRVSPTTAGFARAKILKAIRSHLGSLLEYR